MAGRYREGGREDDWRGEKDGPPEGDFQVLQHLLGSRRSHDGAVGVTEVVAA